MLILTDFSGNLGHFREKHSTIFLIFYGNFQYLMDGIKIAIQQISELRRKIDSGDQNLQYQINQLFNRLKQLEETNKSLQNRIVQLEDENRKLKDQNG